MNGQDVQTMDSKQSNESPMPKLGVKDRHKIARHNKFIYFTSMVNTVTRFASVVFPSFLTVQN